MRAYVNCTHQMFLERVRVSERERGVIGYVTVARINCFPMKNDILKVVDVNILKMATKMRIRGFGTVWGKWVF